MITAQAGSSKNKFVPAGCELLNTETFGSLRINDFIAITYRVNGELFSKAGLFFGNIGDYIYIGDQPFVKDQIRSMRVACVNEPVDVSYGNNRFRTLATGKYLGFSEENDTVKIGKKIIKLSEVVDFNGARVKHYEL